MKSTIGEKLHSLRQERGLRVEDVADHVGVSIATIYRYENGQIEDVPMKNLNRLAELFGVNPSELIGAPAITLRPPSPVKPKPVNLIGVVRISEAAELALHRLAAETGLSLKSVASELIVQAAAICVIEQEVRD